MTRWLRWEHLLRRHPTLAGVGAGAMAGVCALSADSYAGLGWLWAAALCALAALVLWLVSLAWWQMALHRWRWWRR